MLQPHKRYTKLMVGWCQSWHRVLTNLIDGVPMHENYLKTQLSLTAIPESNQFCLLCFDLNADNTPTIRSHITEAAASLKVTKTADKTSGVKVNDTITYTITVENTGNVTVSALALSDALAGVTVGDLDKTTIAPGETATATATAAATAAASKISYMILFKKI